MSERYKHISSPLKVRHMTLKSRFLYPCAQPHFLAGPELYPSESLTAFYEAIAKNGCALITVHDLSNDYQRSSPGFDICHFAMWDFNDPGCQNYFTHFTNHLHYYGSMVCTSMNVDMDVSWTVNDPNEGMGGPMGPMGNGEDEYGDVYTFGSLVGPEGVKEMSGLGGEVSPPTQFTAETIQEYIKIYTDRAAHYKSLGFNAGLINLGGYIGQFFNPKLNHRTDEYGGSRENRLRFLHQFLGTMRKQLGDDFLFVYNCPSPDGDTWTTELIAELVKEAEAYGDILHIRAFATELGTKEECERAPAVELSQQLKALGVKMIIAANTPYMDLDTLDALVADGKVDMISSNHMFMCNDKIGEIMNNGNGEDLEPCLLCHACRGLSWTGNWISACTINPKMGIEYRAKKMIEPFESTKRVAIIGGGPGAMRCAVYLKDRGHEPVIYEKSDHLGGQVSGAKYCDFKWRMARYLDWLEAQLKKRDITIHLNTEATPEMIKAENYDVVIAATGAEPRLPDIPGAEHGSKWNVVNIYGNEDQLGKRVVVIGGASSAAEAAIHLAREGHDVTMIHRKNIIAYDLNPIRQRGLYNKYAHQNGVKIFKEATTTSIEDGLVHFIDKDGAERTVEYDDIIVTGGMEPNRDSAIAFHGTAPAFYMIGDCKQAQNMRLAIRDAYAVAMQIK